MTTANGTVADCAHRLHYLEDKADRARWMKFYRDCPQDSPIAATIKVVETMTNKEDCGILFITGRPEWCRNETSNWLSRHVSFATRRAALLMRADGDRRPDYVVKRELFERSSVDARDVLFVLEDRSSVVAMWREIGLTCWQVAPVDF